MSTSAAPAAAESTSPPPRTSERNGARRADALQLVLMYVASVAGALVVSAILVSTTGGSWRKVFSALLDGSVRSGGAWGLTISTAAPLLIVALGTILATRAGFVNIGQEGQLLVGAACCAYVATRLGGPGALVIVVSLGAAVVGGAVWVGIAAVLRFTRKVPEVISTLLLVFIAFEATTFGLTKGWLLLDNTKRINRVNSGSPLPAHARLPKLHLAGNDISAGAILAVALALALGFVVTRTVWGFRLRMLGLNARTAQRAGVSAPRVGGTALVVSGGLAGLAGGALLMGGTAGDRLTIGYSGNFGWQGLLVALLARDRPLMALPMALVFAGLRTGSGFLASAGVERRITDVVQALLVLALLVPPAITFIRDRRRALAAAKARV